ncbi:benzoate/H(+) symporter BenE family transporter [Corynebacterium sp.]|uniref:benzoate/H(+) symporter BenE family transporter n=1 Tax=Corynebacterium sp. TaxID=1720 RepID=UPI0028A6928C|nr:benzoate/H(+) symporter BenE family transporter [Corynebacterium sp.]
MAIQTDQHVSKFPRLAVEKPSLAPPSIRDIREDISPATVGNGLVALVFSASGPVAVILTAAAQGGLTNVELSSWLFATFLGNGLLTVYLTLRYRTPMAYFWTIPGTVLAGDALMSMSFSEVIGAYMVTGIVVFLLGWTGLSGRLMAVIPLPVIMAMVAGLFLRFGLDLVSATGDSPLLATAMIVVFMALTVMPRAGAFLPPVAGAAVIGIIVAVADGSMDAITLPDGVLATPTVTAPEFSAAAMAELVLPLVVTVVIVQNGQGEAVLRAAGHHPPVNTASAASGLATLPLGLLGAAPTCLTGPTNALLVASGRRDTQYTAALVCGLAAVVVGLFSPAFVAAVTATPAAFIAVLAGLAMLTPLKNAFVTSFSGPHTTGALICLVVTFSDITLFGITAPFWGIVFGMIATGVIDRSH